jgi:hypothetical protein
MPRITGDTPPAVATSEDAPSVVEVRRTRMGRVARVFCTRLVLGPVCLVLLGIAVGGLGLVNETGVPAAGASDVKLIELTDNPGNWFDTGQTSRARAH